LVLTVVVLSEQNAEVQPGLPEGANAVNETARTLAKIARQLAGSNYKNFPPIAKEINEASDAVDVATGTMASAIEVLVSAADRKMGWNRLVDACRVMSGKTIRLLQIVYGADLERLMIVSDDLLDMLNRVDTGDLKTNPKKFMQEAQAAANQTNQMAQYLNQRAQETESPLAKAQMLQDAKNLASRAQEMISHVNNCLTDPNSAQKAQDCADFVSKLKKEVEAAKHYAKDNAPEAPQVVLPPGMADVEYGADPSARGPGAKKPNQSPFQKDIDRANQRLTEIMAAVEKGNVGALAPAVKSFKEVSDMLGKSGADMAADPHTSSGKKQDIDDSSRKINENLAPIIQHAKNAINNPGNAEAKQGLADAVKNMENLLDDFGRATRRGNLNENLETLKNILDDINATKHRGDQARMTKLIKDMTDTQKNIQDQVSELVSNNKNPQQAKGIIDTLDALQNKIDEVAGKASHAADSKVDSDVQEAKRRVDELIQKTNAKPIAAGEAANRAKDAAVHSAQRGDTHAIQADAFKVKNRTDDLLAAANNASKNPTIDPQQQNKIKQAMDQLEQANKQFDKAAQQAIRDPAKGKYGLGDAADDYSLAVGALDNALGNAHPADTQDLRNEIDQLKKDFNALPGKAVNTGNGVDPFLADALKRLKDANARVLGEPLNPEQKRKAEDVQKKIDNIAPKVQQAVVAAKNNPSGRSDAENTVKNVVDLLAELDQVIAPPTLEQAAEQLIIEIEHTAHNPYANPEKDLAQVTIKHNEFKKLVKAAIHQKDPQQREKLFDELDGLNNKMARFDDHVRDKKSQLDINAAGDDTVRKIQDLVKRIRFDQDGEVHKHPGKDSDSFLQDEIDKATKLVKEIVSACENENPSALTPAATGLKALLENLQQGANKVANDPFVCHAKQTDVCDAANAFNEAFAPLIQNAKSSLQNPTSPEAKKGLVDAADNMEKLLGDLAAATAKPSLEEGLDHMKALLDQMVAAKAQGDNAKLHKVGKELNDTHNRVKDQAAYLAAVNKNPKQRKAINNALDDVDQIIISISANSRNPHSNQKEISDDANYGKKKIDELNQRLHAKPIADVDDVKRAHDSAVHAAQRHNPAAVQRDAEKVKQRTGELVQVANQASKSPNVDFDQQAKIKQAADQLEHATRNFENAARQAVQDPIKGKHALRDAAGDCQVAVGALDNALKNVQQEKADGSELQNDIQDLKFDFAALPSTAVNKPKDVDPMLNDALRRLKDANARALAEPNLSPDQQKKIAEASKRADALTPEIQAAIQNAKNNPGSRPEAENVIAKVNTVLDVLGDAVAPPTLQKAGNDLLNQIAATKQNPTPNNIAELGKKQSQFNNLANAQINSNQDPQEKARLQDDLNNVNNQVARLGEALRQKKPAHEVDPLENDSKRKINDLLGKMHAQALDDAEKAVEAANALKAASALNDDPSVQSNALELKAVVAKLKDGVPIAAQNLPPDTRAKLNGALMRALNAADNEIDAATYGKNQPDQQAKVKNACEDVGKAIKDIKDTLKNRDPDAPVSKTFYDNDVYEDSSDEEEVTIQATALNRLPPVSEPDHKSVLANQIARLKNVVDAVQENAGKADAVGVAVNAIKAKKDLQDLDDTTHKAIQDIPSHKRPQVDEALARVNRAIPNQLEAAKKVLENPNSPEAKKGLQNETEKLKSALDNLEKTTRPDLADELIKMRENIDHLAAANKIGDRGTVNDRGNRILDAHPKIVKEVQYCAQESKNEPTRMAILQPLGAFKKTVPDLVDHSKRGILDPEELAAAYKALDDIMRATNADAISAIRKLNLIADDLVDASNQRNIPISSDIAAALVGQADNTGLLVKGVAMKSHDPVQQEKINTAAQEIPHATKNVLLASKRVLDHPDDPQAKAGLRDAQKELRDLTDNLVSAIQNNAAVPQEKKQLDTGLSALQHLVPKLDSDIGKVKQNQRDPTVKKNVIKDSAKIGNVVKNVADTVAPKGDPRAIALLNAEGVRHRIRAIVQAVEDNDEPRFQVQLRKLERDIPVAVAALKNVPTQPEDREAVLQALVDLESYAPVLATIAKPVFKNPHDIEKKNDVAEAAKKLDRVVLRATRKAVPDATEKEIVDAGAALRAKIAAIKAKRANQPAPLPQPEEEDWRNVRNRLRKAGEKKNQWAPQSDGPSQELKDLWNKFDQKQKESRNTPQDIKDIALIEDEIANSVQRLIKTTEAEKIAPVIDFEDVLDDVVVAADLQQTDRVRPQLGVLNAKLKDLQAQNQSSPVIASMAAPIKEVIVKALDASQNPTDETKAKEVKEAVERAKVYTAQLKKELDPAPLNRNPELELQKTKAALAKIDQIARSGDKAALAPAVGDAKKQARVAADEVRKLAQQDRCPPSKKIRLQKVANDLDDQVAKLDAGNHPSQIAHNTHKSDDAVTDCIDALRKDAHDNLITATAGALNESDVLTTYGKQLNPQEVSQIADNLSTHSKNLMAAADDVSKDIGRSQTTPTVKPAQSPVSMPSAVQAIAQTPHQQKPQPVLDVVIADIQGIAYPKPAPKVVKPPPVVKKAPQSFEDVVDNVAEDISAKAREVECAVAGDIGTHLANLARYARSGDRQSMLQEARAAALKIAELCKMLRDYAQRIPGKTHQEKVIQDRLIRAAQSLSNYATQLKILTSVKAASLDRDKDTDESLTSIVTGIGKQIDEGLTSLDITDRAIFKTKK